MIAGPSPYAGTTPAISTATPTTLVEGQTFCLSGRNGDITPEHPHGLFVLDSRVLSHLELRLNGHALEPLAVDSPDGHQATFVARAQPAVGRADADVVAFRHRDIGNGLRDRIVVTNHGLEAVPLLVELLCDADFADLFAVKEGRVVGEGRRVLRRDAESVHYGQVDRSDASKRTRVGFSVPGEVESGGATWSTTLDPKCRWELCVEVTVRHGAEPVSPRFRCDGPDDDAPAERHRTWRARLPRVESDNPALVTAVDTAGRDLGALRIFDPDHPDTPILAAGAPWFMTVFGRDSLLTAWMTLIADHELAGGVLETLARLQGTDVVPESEEEPGKIIHEMRFDTAPGPALSAGHRYYGSIDATPLFVMLVAELRRWNPDSALVERLLPHVDRALAWIEEHGDRDGDGYVEYQCSHPGGLANQGWKDSWDAIRHADGELARPPIALCEVQGYVYGAYLARAHLALQHDDVATAELFRQKAMRLRERFNEDFWVDQHGWFALALDADKRPVDVLTSNIGHCLWTGIVDPERADAIAGHMTGPDLFSGWGVRTLQRSAVAFNPVSYHNGSVWPHDNALCAAGLMRYGHVDAAHQVIEAQLDASRHHDGRLPEVFAGFSRDELARPASYPTSCSPQAWASAAPLLWLRTLLRLDPAAEEGRLYLDPALSSSIGRLHIEGIRIAGRDVVIEADRDGTVVTGDGHLAVVEAPHPPLSSILDEAVPPP